MKEIDLWVESCHVCYFTIAREGKTKHSLLLSEADFRKFREKSYDTASWNIWKGSLLEKLKTSQNKQFTLYSYKWPQEKNKRIWFKISVALYRELAEMTQNFKSFMCAAEELIKLLICSLLVHLHLKNDQAKSFPHKFSSRVENGSFFGLWLFIFL